MTAGWRAAPQQIPMTARAECGTRRGRDLHKKVGEPVCVDCLRWYAAYERNRVQQARRRAVLAEAVYKRVDNRVRITERLSDA